MSSTTLFRIAGTRTAMLICIYRTDNRYMAQAGLKRYLRAKHTPSLIKILLPDSNVR